MEGLPGSHVKIKVLVIFHMLVEKSRELWRKGMGGFLSKKLLQTRGAVVIVIYICLEPKPSIFWKIWPRKRFRSTSPPKKKGHLSPRCTISPSNRGSQLQMHKQHPWNGPYPRCGRGQEASSPRQGEVRIQTDEQSRLSSWWVADGWAHEQSSTIKDWNIFSLKIRLLSRRMRLGLASSPKWNLSHWIHSATDSWQMLWLKEVDSWGCSWCGEGVVSKQGSYMCHKCRTQYRPWADAAVNIPDFSLNGKPNFGEAGAVFPSEPDEANASAVS